MARLTCTNQSPGVCHHPQPEPVCLYPPGGSVHACVTLPVCLPDDWFSLCLRAHHSPLFIRSLLTSNSQQTNLTSIQGTRSRGLFNSGPIVSKTNQSGATPVRRLSLARVTGGLAVCFNCSSSVADAEGV